MSEDLKGAYEGGQRAYRLRQPVENCPHQNPQEKIAWAQGWLDAHFAATLGHKAVAPSTRIDVGELIPLRGRPYQGPPKAYQGRQSAIHHQPVGPLDNSPNDAPELVTCKPGRQARP